jgi:N-acetylneuraminate synthase/N,N'-diacetyllegionaminate synthase
MKKTIIIAEAGVNHNGELSKAKELIKVAADAGADFVKFQTFKADKMVSKSAKKATYQTKNFNDQDDSQYNMLKRLEMPLEWYDELLAYAHRLNISFLSTGFDEDSMDFLDSLDPELFKIPSGEITNKPYLEHIGRKGRKVLLSTGMANMEEILQAIAVLQQAGLDKQQITVLHCNTEYPTPMKDVNLMAMLHIQKELGVEVGYSDHTLGIEVPIAAVSLGAKVIEKHFTLDRNLSGPDHKASLEPEELKAMVSSIRNIEQAITGSGRKEPSESEKINKAIARKSIHLLKKLKAGHVIQKADLIMRRPGDGISPMEIEDVLGKVINKDLQEDSKLLWADLN